MHGNEIEIMFLTPDEKGTGYITVEEPDEVYGFKSARISYPDLKVMAEKGFTGDEMNWIKNLLKDNLKFIIHSETYSFLG